MTDTCVCCGAYVPEGRMVCNNCEEKYLDTDDSPSYELVYKISRTTDHSASKAAAARNRKLHKNKH